MSVSFHADVLVPGTATFSWATDAAACITEALPEAVVTDLPGHPPSAGAPAPLLATLPDGYEFSFSPAPTPTPPPRPRCSSTTTSCPTRWSAR